MAILVKVQTFCADHCHMAATEMWQLPVKLETVRATELARAAVTELAQELLGPWQPAELTQVSTRH
jgi:hypothetical protein